MAGKSNKISRSGWLGVRGYVMSSWRYSMCTQAQHSSLSGVTEPARPLKIMINSLLIITTVALALACAVSHHNLDTAERENAQANRSYAQAVGSIEQYNAFRGHLRQVVTQSERTVALLETKRRSGLLTAIIDALPAGSTLNDLTIEVIPGGLIRATIAGAAPSDAGVQQLATEIAKWKTVRHTELRPAPATAEAGGTITAGSAFRIELILSIRTGGQAEPGAGNNAQASAGTR
jgi:hypothetical protein